MSVSQQLKQQFDFLNNAPTTTLAPTDIAAIQKAYGFEQPRQHRLSASEREANLAMFNANLEEQSREMGKAFATNTSSLPAEERYRAWQDAQEAFKSQHANLSEEQQQTALSAFNEHADVFRQADEEAGFFSRTGDLLSYIPTTFTKLGEQAVGLVAPDSDLRKWFTETTADVENWRSDESKMRALQASNAMAQAKANGEFGFTQFFANAAENPLETLGGFAESALPTVAAAAVGVAAAPVTGGTSLALPAIVGGVQGAGATRNEIYDHIKAMPQEQLNQSPEYQALLATGLSPEQAREELASSLMEHGGEVLATGLSSAALSQLGGLGRIGQAGKGVLGSTAGKFTSELLTEPTDEVFQQYMGNSAIHDIDQTHSLTDGLGEAAAGGLLFGAAGGAVAAADNAYRTPSATQAQANNDQAIDDVVNVQPEPQQAQTEQTAQPKSQVNGNVLESILSAYQNDEARFKELYKDLASDIQDGKLQQRLNEGDREYANLARAYLEQTGQLQPQQAVETPQNVANQNDQALDAETKAEQALYSRSPMKSVEANIKRGQERMTQAILDKADVKRGMYNQEFGWVDFVWGDDGTTKGVNRFGEPRGRGLAHIYEARMRKDGLTEQQVTQMLTNDIVETIAKGTPKQSNRAGNERLELNYLNPNNGQTHRAILTRNKGSNSWLLTGFEVGGGATRPGSATSSPTHINRTHSRDDVVAPMYPNDPNKGRKANSNGERTVGYGTSTPTQTTPMRSRDNLGALEMHQQAGYGLNVHQSTPQRNRQIAQDQQTLSRILGEETASHIQVVDRNTKVPSGRDVKQLATKGVEGWFEPSTQKLYIISDNITANDVLSRDERLAWVAFHELAHAGVRIKYGHLLTNVLASASQNVVVKVLARKIQAEHGYEREIAIEEAMMEIYAAYETGNWAELESRYKTKIHESYKQGKNSVGDFLTRVANALRRLIGGIIGKDLTQTMTTSQVFDTLRGIQQGINDIAKTEQNQTASVNNDVRYSLNEEPSSEFAKAVDTVAQGGSVAGYVNVGTTPDVLKMLGLPDVKVTIHGSTFKKVMQDKHNVTPETLKQLPKQINDPVAVMKSSTEPNGYIVLTELVENENGREKPVIAALHLKQDANGIELLNIASVYGRSNSQIQRGLDNDLLYWNKVKGTNFVSTFGLQLPAYADENSSLSANDIKTNDDLSQYQSENSDSNLSEAAYNQAKAEGKTELTFQQWKQVRSPEFKAWFGDWENDPENASKVINPKTGEPLVVYHGTDAIFTEFKDIKKQNRGFWFTPKKEIADRFSNGKHIVLDVFVNIRNPKKIEFGINGNTLFDEFNKFDGIYKENSVVIAKHPNQIKSATDNNGQFSSENDDIRFSLRENPNSEFAKQAEPKRRASSFDEARAIVSEFLGEPLVNKATGMVATVSKRSLEKLVSGKAHTKSTSLEDHLLAVANIDSLFENAVQGWVEPHKTDTVNIAGMHKMFAPLLVDDEMKLVKITVKEMNFNQGNKIYSVETIEVENEIGTVPEMTEVLTGNSNIAPHRLHGTDTESLIQRIKDFNSSDENSDNIRYSVKQSVDDLAKTGKAKQDASQMSKLRSFDGFKSLVKDVGGWLDERVTDGLRPVNDWIDTFKQSGIAAHEAERLKDDMYRAKGVRDALNSELESAYLNPIIKKVAAIAKANKMDELSAKRLAGYWISGRYAIEKNNSLLKQDHQAMLDAEKALNEANANGDEEAITLANREYRKAERQYRYRKHDVELALDSDEEFQVGTAGGWSNAEAANFMQNIEKHIPKKDLEALAELVYDLNQKRLEIDHQVGRYTEEQYNEYKANRHYVPLTGDPNADDDFDGISGAGSNALNVSKDRALKGRKLSEAEDGIDASWRAIGKSTTYAGWADFKNRIDFIYETKVDELVEKGYSTRSAREEVENTLGISKSKMKGLTRSNDDVLIRKVGGEYFEYRLPQKVMQALKNDNVEHANAFLKLLSKPASWYARGVTQWTITFAPMNMMRDAWEKSEFIRVQKLYDKEGNLLDSKTMDKIGRAVLKNAFLDKSIWAATKRLGFNQTLRDSGSEGLLKQLLKDGGVSTYSTYLAKTETDLIKKLKAENNPLAKKLEQAGALLEGYNKIFDNVSALSAYKALIDHGVDPKQAAAKTLELTNFRKTGSKMRGIKALYMFSQPTAMGARNLIKYLSTPKGQKRFIGYMAVMMPLYAALRALDDDDEGGNKMDQLGDITRYIPLPLGLDKYFKIPVGFGMPQMAWNFSVNMVKAMQSDMPISEAATNMFVHSMKTFAPISPSEISAAKFPLEKLALTATPTILQPLMQNVLNRSAFGSQITTNFVRDDKLKSEQSKSTTAQFWKDIAVELNDVLGIDMHPEQIKNLLDGYGSMLGSLKELQTIFIENPNREQLGRRTRIPFLNQLIGTTNEFAIQSRYYEASEEAQTLANEYNSRKERGKLDGWLDAEKLKIVKWHERNEKLMANTTKEKSKLTRQLRSGTINANVYEARLKVYNQKMDVVQRTLLNQWREMQGLNTTKSR